MEAIFHRVGKICNSERCRQLFHFLLPPNHERRSDLKSSLYGALLQIPTVHGIL